MIQLAVTSIKDFLKRLKGAEAASVVAYAQTEGTSVPRQIPDPSIAGQESFRRQSGVEYAPSNSVRDLPLPGSGQADHVPQEWVTERSGLDYSSDEEQGKQ